MTARNWPARDPAVRFATFEVHTDAARHRVVHLRPPPPLPEPRHLALEVPERDAVLEPAPQAGRRAERGGAHAARQPRAGGVGGAGHHPTLERARRVLVETPQHRIEELRAVVVRPHPVAQQHIDGRLVVEPFEVRGRSCASSSV